LERQQAGTRSDVLRTGRSKTGLLDILAYDDALGVHPGKIAFADGRLFAEWA
jgi:hypothetical protein